MPKTYFECKLDLKGGKVARVFASSIDEAYDRFQEIKEKLNLKEIKKEDISSNYF